MSIFPKLRVIFLKLKVKIILSEPLVFGGVLLMKFLRKINSFYFYKYLYGFI